ncbi:hypothetical protein [Pseudomonas sp. SIMBA_068]|uniref:hypothetical protein n=1 Tax=Pseudomonas sp. SIMBA_068 TaxID=3085808 RepID=UPI00397A1CAB
MFKDLTNFSYQLALFTESGKIMADELSVACRNKMNIGAYTPALIPEMPGMPDEIPRLQIQTDRGFQVGMSNIRIDFVIDLPFGLDSKDREGFIENARRLLELLDERGFVYSRVGFVKKYLKVMPDAGKFLSGLFGGVGGSSLTDFSVNASQRIEVAGKQCNNIFNVGSGVIRGGEVGVVALRDVNIVPGQGSIVKDDVLSFMAEAESILGVESFDEFVGG